MTPLGASNARGGGASCRRRPADLLKRGLAGERAMEPTGRREAPPDDRLRGMRGGLARLIANCAGDELRNSSRIVVRRALMWQRAEPPKLRMPNCQMGGVSMPVSAG